MAYGDAGVVPLTGKTSDGRMTCFTKKLTAARGFWRRIRMRLRRKLACLHQNGVLRLTTQTMA